MTTDARTKRDAAIRQVEENAYQEWLAHAHEAIGYLCMQRETFTTDSVWAALEAAGAETHEPRAMGAVMCWAKRQGWIETTGEYVRSKRPACNARPIAVWRSVLFTQDAAA